MFSVQENWGGGADTSENLILEEKLYKKGGGKGLKQINLKKIPKVFAL